MTVTKQAIIKTNCCIRKILCHIFIVEQLLKRKYYNGQSLNEYKQFPLIEVEDFIYNKM